MLLIQCLLPVGTLAVSSETSTSCTNKFIIQGTDRNACLLCSSSQFGSSDPSIGWFSIHGLWPNYAQGGGPTCCNNPDFDMAKVC
ncbi:hypothetical protein BDA96_02G278700 [Sorghum bicolor]|uniref:Uncharacterized protein n=2 Tax=Sorghum bicolor TaxID=4558 RepID=A0A921UUA2_SORBI|nr:hypothetical protein BDA96_02G278700 [Sorghum bicolor]OQU89779.1 hypothetical protein SORBI_3002G265166 [Sorghum bicolor]